MTKPSLLNRLEHIINKLKLLLQQRDYALIPYLMTVDSNFYNMVLPGSGPCHQNEPHPLFDSSYYRQLYLEADYSGHPFAHYMRRGRHLGYKPSPFYDEDIYFSTTPAHVKRTKPLHHYSRTPLSERHNPGIFFDYDWYVDQIPSLDPFSYDNIIHYRLFGARDGKSPVPVFDPAYYRQRSNLPSSTIDVLTHYLIHGIHHDEKPCSHFDPVWYREKYSTDLGSLSPFEHYLRTGLKDGFYPNASVDQLTSKPLISIVVPVYNANPSFLANCIRSVLHQSYPHWQLCLADDGSNRPETLAQLQKWATRDSRIDVVYHEHNRGISAATNAAAQLANGDYIGFLDNDDELTPECLYNIVQTINEKGAELIYTDEDLIGDDGQRLSLFRKPAFNRELLHSHNYVTHFVTASVQLFKQADGFRSECDGAQDFDLFLRLSLLTDKICHIPKVLYHWRASETSTSINPGQKDYAQQAGIRALTTYLNKAGIDGSAEETEIKYYYRVRRNLNVTPGVEILLWGDEDGQTRQSTVSTLREATGYVNCEFSKLVTDVHLYKALHAAIRNSDAEYITLLDARTISVEAEWLHELISVAASEATGIACGRIVLPKGDGPSYVSPDIGNQTTRYYRRYLEHHPTHCNGLHCSQQTVIPSPEVCLFSKKIYCEAGGFDLNHFTAELGLADLALRLAENNYTVLFTPHCRITTEEPQPEENKRECHHDEKKDFQRKWGDSLSRNSAFIHPGLLADRGVEKTAYMYWLTGRDRS